MGAEKEAPTPTAQQAKSILVPGSRLRAMHAAMCTLGPSLPTGRPAATSRDSAVALTTSTRIDRKSTIPLPNSTLPNSMAFMSGKPLPSASAHVRTRILAATAIRTLRAVAESVSMCPPSVSFDRKIPTTKVNWSMPKERVAERTAVITRSVQNLAVMLLSWPCTSAVLALTRCDSIGLRWNPLKALAILDRGVCAEGDCAGGDCAPWSVLKSIVTWALRAHLVPETQGLQPGASCHLPPWLGRSWPGQN
eukprot:CAMPEP_0115150280 /NCGR_PEP_ID=MMETSP0227-20121206/64955_1 /TAXON_ID=89957 /ORGANISM="Polarella glacialis, Strain CCMP 1383" /LENGTH=249 /DNA_ID=CAMNT_0002560635 /DNA_START=68 /DNA_END=817 /DNA_ORIENTATION=-